MARALEAAVEVLDGALGGRRQPGAWGGRAAGYAQAKHRRRYRPAAQDGLGTIMITGDNRLTAATIAKRAGAGDFLAEATPEAKLALLTRRAKTRAVVWLVPRPLADQAFGWSSGRVSRWPQPALFAQYSQVRQVSTE
jgi:hypothetical protein